jgi:phosphate starvation-inducible PhoH-like protein
MLFRDDTNVNPIGRPFRNFFSVTTTSARVFIGDLAIFFALRANGTFLHPFMVLVKQKNFRDYMSVIAARTPQQALYVTKLLDTRKSIVVASGPAGCGKTLFACKAAVHSLITKKVDTIIITRPTVSVDEELGFLPGKLEKKMEPWVKPMFEIFEKDRVQKSVEIVPLAYMRGRTFKRSFIIADEMQNSTPNQMKMVLTRLGEGSKMIVTGDLDQSDIRFTNNGLRDLFERIGILEYTHLDRIMFSNEDIQRHPAVSEVLNLYI